jgi:hypothetical protein
MMTPDTTTSLVVTVTSTADTFGVSMAPLDFWTFVCTTDCWILQGETPVAVADPDLVTEFGMFVPAGVTLTLSGKGGADLSVVRDTADGVAVLVRNL